MERGRDYFLQNLVLQHLCHWFLPPVKELPTLGSNSEWLSVRSTEEFFNHVWLIFSSMEFFYCVFKILGIILSFSRKFNTRQFPKTWPLHQSSQALVSITYARTPFLSNISRWKGNINLCLWEIRTSDSSVEISTALLLRVNLPFLFYLPTNRKGSWKRNRIMDFFSWLMVYERKRKG